MEVTAAEKWLKYILSSYSICGPRPDRKLTKFIFWVKCVNLDVRKGRIYLWWEL